MQASSNSVSIFNLITLFSLFVLPGSHFSTFLFINYLHTLSISLPFYPIMSSVKKNEQNNTESEEYKARLNYGAEKEKQIMNQIRKNRQQKYDSVMKTSMLGGMFEFCFKKN